MIENILTELAQKINTNCLFLSKPCGVARLQRERVDKKVKIYPVVPNLNPDTCNTQPYVDMIPNTSESAFCYFEVLDNIIKDKNTRSLEAIATVRIVGWVNTSKFDNYRAGSIEDALLKQLNEKSITIPEGLRINSINLIRIEPKTAQVFSKYTYDEVETQYLMHPFDFFSIQFSVAYFNGFYCAENPTLSTNNQC